MTERNDKTFLAPRHNDLDALQERATVHRDRHVRSRESIVRVRTSVTASLDAPVQAVRRLPTRYLVHSVVVVAILVAIGLSQIPITPVTQQAISPDSSLSIAEAPVRLGPVVRSETLSDIERVGDPPLQPSDAMPLPMSLTSRSEALAPIAVPATIAHNTTTKLFGGPSLAYDAFGELSANSSIEVVGRYGDWLQVSQGTGNDNEMLWVPVEAVDIPIASLYTLFEVQEQDIPPPPPPKIATVQTPNLALLDGPGLNYVRLLGLNEGVQVSLLEQYGDWLHVATDTLDGWVSRDQMHIADGVLHRIPEAVAIPDANPAMVATVVGGAVNVREGPGTAYATVGTVDFGSRVDLLATHDGWYQIGLGSGSDGWVHGDLLDMSGMVQRRVAYTNDIPALPIADANPADVAGAVAMMNDVAAADKDTIDGVIYGAAADGSASYSAMAADYSASGLPASGDVASFALQFVGHAYVWGGASPGAFDCSGLVMYVYSQYGVQLPHNAAAQYSTAYGAVVGSVNNLAPGDMVFFAGTAGPGITHVGLYIGGGRFVHAMMPGLGVQVSSLWEPYWMSHYHGAIRVRR